MNIDVPLKTLGEVDARPLIDTVLALGEDAWRLNVNRQQDYEVHRQTESIVMVFCDGPPDNLEVRKEPGWDRLADVAVPLMHEIIAKHYSPGGTIIRAMAAKLKAGGKITPHRDHHPSFHAGHRIHIPITTNPRVRFMIDGRPYQFEVGQAYEINNQLQHSVANKGDDDRITFIFDYVPAEQLGRQS